MTSTSEVSTIIGLGILSFLRYTSLFFLSSKNKKIVGSVSRIVLYPVKSCAGICVDSAFIKDSCISANGVYDRSYAVISSKDNSFQNQRRCSKLSTVCPIFDPDQFGKVILTRVGDNPIKVNTSGPRVVFQMRAETLTGIDCGDEVAEWLNRACDRNDLRLVFGFSNYRSIPEELPYLERSDLLYMPTTNLVNSVDFKLWFADLAPILLLSEKSISELNEKLADKGSQQLVDWRSFRPNVVVSITSDNEEEDKWQFVYTDNCTLTCVLPAERCTMTTVNQDSGLFRKDGEPLKTLKTYRHDPNWTGTGCLFGVYCFIEREGVVTVGEDISTLKS